MHDQANIIGYRAVIEAANAFGRLFANNSLIDRNRQLVSGADPNDDAASTELPVNVLVIGVGAAGMSAIRTAQSMGATVRACDTRAEAAMHVEAMGAEYLYATDDAHLVSLL